MSDKKSPLFWVAFGFTFLAGIFVAVPALFWLLWLIMKAWNAIFNFFIYIW